GGGIGVGHRLFLRDLAFDKELEKRLLEGLRAWRHALFQRVLDLVDLAFLDQLGDMARVEQHLSGGNTSAGLGAHQALRDDRLQRGGEVEQQARPVLEGVEVDDAVHRVVAVIRVQRREAQVARLRIGERHRHGLLVADLADQDAIGRLAQRDRKSTRLNSSHRTISYAVFCLKKKIKTVLIYIFLYIFFFNDTAPTEIYTLSLHDALPICRS